MKSFVIILLFVDFTTSLFAQKLQKEIVVKPAIDTSVFGKWPSAEMPIISGDGSYALYLIRNQPVGAKTLVVRSLKNEWKREIIDASNALFTCDSRKMIFIDPRKTLSILNLDRGIIDSVAKTSAYQLIKQDDEEWLVYQLDNAAKDLKAVNLKSNVEKLFTGVIDYLFNSAGNVLVLLKQWEPPTDNLSQAIEWINFPSGNSMSIWSGNGASNFVFDGNGKQLAFVAEMRDPSSKEGKIEKTVFYYKAGKEKAELMADNSSKGVDSSLIIEGISGGFSKDGEKLFITLKEKDRPKPQPGAVMVDVWSYKDVKLQSMQLLELPGQELYNAVIRIDDHQVVQLLQEGDRDISFVEQWSNKVYASRYAGDLLEAHWNVGSKKKYYLVSTDNGERQQLKIEPESVSSTGKYIVGKLPDDPENLYCYNTSTGKIQNITHLISAPFDKELDDKPRFLHTKWLEMGRWLENDEGILIFDRYDMWLVYPDGINPPVNLTNGYGLKNKIIFRLPEVYRNKSIANIGKIFLKGFNRFSKEEGFYVVQLMKPNNPRLLTKGPYSYEIPDIPFNSEQLNSSGSKRFLVRRESATHSPNYFLTTDFKIFIPISDVSPEASYNWLTAELHTWKSLNGESLQGILYKPQNFDARKKYPVIFHYYQRMSDQLHKYLTPGAITDHLNVPFFVSNCYLVFTPDIHYEIGKTGESALNAVLSAAYYLKKLPWVDGRKMGLQGQSFGGYETNYIITHSNLFAAAMSSAGISDFVSDYNGISHWGRSRQSFYEAGQNRIKATLWERPDLYIKNSPIFNANKVTTPVLMMNNKDDGAVPFSQGIEFFTALRRLGKRAWMLQYDGETHVISPAHKAVALQHTIRVTQFFDHYLKRTLAPIWMTRGIEASMKGIKDGMEMDLEISTPGEGLLKEDEKRKSKR